VGATTSLEAVDKRKIFLFGREFYRISAVVQLIPSLDND
jgi:hypothetical protein